MGIYPNNNNYAFGNNNFTIEFWFYKINNNTARIIGNNNWYKTVNASNVYFNTHNSILTFIYDLEFKKNYKTGLNSSYKNKTGLGLSTMNSNISYSNDFFTNKLNKYNISKPYYIYLNNIKNNENIEQL